VQDLRPTPESWNQTVLSTVQCRRLSEAVDVNLINWAIGRRSGIVNTFSCKTSGLSELFSTHGRELCSLKSTTDFNVVEPNKTSRSSKWIASYFTTSLYFAVTSSRGSQEKVVLIVRDLANRLVLQDPCNNQQQCRRTCTTNLLVA
jgi:hypothetical protein